MPMHVLADLAGRSETSDEVLLYRALETQVWADQRLRATIGVLSRSVCGQANNAPRLPLSRMPTQVGATQQFNTFAKCNVEASVHNSCRKFQLHQPTAWSGNVERIAYIQYFRELAERSHFSPKVIGGDLEAMEAQVLEDVAKRLQGWRGAPASFASVEQQLAIHWNETLRQYPPGGQTWLPALQVSTAPPQCIRAGEIAVTIRSEPPGARVRLISDYDWRLCDALNHDPWDPAKCWGWTALPANGAMLSGTYRYQADWPDGKSSRDTVDAKIVIGQSPVIELR
jgi:hypothetical protein